MGQAWAFFSGKSRFISVAGCQRTLEGFLRIPAWMSHPRGHLPPEENSDLSVDYIEDYIWPSVMCRGCKEIGVSVSHLVNT